MKGSTNRSFGNFLEYGLKGVSTKLPNYFVTSFTPYIMCPFAFGSQINKFTPRGVQLK